MTRRQEEIIKAFENGQLAICLIGLKPETVHVITEAIIDKGVKWNGGALIEKKSTKMLRATYIALTKDDKGMTYSTNHKFESTAYFKRHKMNYVMWDLKQQHYVRKDRNPMIGLLKCKAIGILLEAEDLFDFVNWTQDNDFLYDTTGVPIELIKQCMEEDDTLKLVYLNDNNTFKTQATIRRLRWKLSRHKALGYTTRHVMTWKMFIKKYDKYNEKEIQFANEQLETLTNLFN